MHANPLDIAEPRALPLPGLRVNGYLLSAIGLGEALRNLALAAETANVPLSYRAARLPGRETLREAAPLLRHYHPRKAELFCYGLTPSPEMLRHADSRARVICYPFWELSGLVRELAEPGPIDEYWAPSRFIGDALEKSFGEHRHTPRPVIWIPQPIPLPPSPVPPRAARETLRIYTFFDTDSFVSRKNPQGAVRAFRNAFPPHRRDVQLVVKLKGSQDGGLRDWLARQAAEDDRIEVIDKLLTPAQMADLMSGCDAFLSLHRSEGFGLGPAEALAQGKMVISSTYGGTADFITQETAYPVPCEEVPISDGDYIHSAGQVWGEPDMDVAIDMLRKAYDEPEDGVRRARAGHALLTRQHGLAAVGARIRRRLDELGLLDAAP